MPRGVRKEIKKDKKEILAGLRPAGGQPRFLARRYTLSGIFSEFWKIVNVICLSFFSEFWKIVNVICLSFWPRRPAGLPAGGRQNLFIFLFISFYYSLLTTIPPRLGGRQAPCPPRERGQSVVNNYERSPDSHVKGEMSVGFSREKNPLRSGHDPQ